MNNCRVLPRILWHHHPVRIFAAPCIIGLQSKCVTIRDHATTTIDESYVKKFMNAVGLMDLTRTRLKLTGYFLYECIPNNIAYEEWITNLNLPDTFTSWFVITELHIWMLMVRCMAEDYLPTAAEKQKYVKGDGHFIRNCIVEALWSDVGNRIKLLEGANPAIARRQVVELSEQFQAALIAYDEGLDDDRVLAGAIWRRFYAFDENAKPENVEKIVAFIRQQVSELDKIPSNEFKKKKDLAWISILKLR